jgi:hypothetical protein
MKSWRDCKKAVQIPGVRAIFMIVLVLRKRLIQRQAEFLLENALSPLISDGGDCLKTWRIATKCIEEAATDH